MARGRQRQSQRGRGRGAFVDYYEDLGAAATKEGYADWKSREDQYAAGKADWQKDISKSQSKYDEAKAKVDSIELGEKPSYDKMYSEAWDNFTKNADYMDVKIVNGQQVEGTYKVPKKVATEIWKQTKDFYHSNVGDDGVYYVDVNTKGGGARGAELHEAYGKAQQDIKDLFEKEATPKISQIYSAANKQYGQSVATLEGYKSQLEGARASIGQSKSELAAVDKQKAKTADDFKKDYQKRLKNIENTIGAFNVKRGNIRDVTGG